MTETRGLPPASITSTGGAVREIRAEAIEAALLAAFGKKTAQPACIDRLLNVLRIRVVEIDCPPLNTRDSGNEINTVSKSASDLIKALQGPSMQNLLLEVQFVPVLIADQATLFAWLGRLAHLDSYLEKRGPSDAYDTTYRTLAAILREYGYTLPKTGGKAFLAFLSTLESAYPTLIFRANGAPSGRAKLVERAL